MVPWWLLPVAFTGGGLVSYYFAYKIYEGGEALYNKVKAAASAEEARILTNLRVRL